jgi:hypothetical protein
MASANRPTPLSTHHPRGHPSRSARVLVALAGAVLFVYGSLTVFVASAWGPGNSDELVSGGPELVPWYGLSSLGTVAAVVALALTPWPRRARWALLTATVSLAAWTAFLFSIPD